VLTRSRSGWSRRLSRARAGPCTSGSPTLQSAAHRAWRAWGSPPPRRRRRRALRRARGPLHRAQMRRTRPPGAGRARRRHPGEVPQGTARQAPLNQHQPSGCPPAPPPGVQQGARPGWPPPSRHCGPCLRTGSRRRTCKRPVLRADRAAPARTRRRPARRSAAARPPRPPLPRRPAQRTAPADQRVGGGVAAAGSTKNSAPTAAAGCLGALAFPN